MAKLAFCLVSAAFRKESSPHEAIILVPPADTNGKVTPVSGSRSIDPKTFKIVWKMNMDVAAQAAML